MKSQSMVFVRTTIATALLSAFFPAQAEVADEITRLTKPDSEIRIGAGFLSDDNRWFGQYNGLNNERFSGRIDFDVNQRDDATGTRLNISGSRLGQEDAEFRLEQAAQGNWGYAIEFNRTPRYDPLVINSRLPGLETTSIGVNPGAATARIPVNLHTLREKLAIGFGKQINDQLDANVRFQTEDKTGTRMFGASSNMFAPEPINSTTNQWEAKLGYQNERLQLSGGYYGSSYRNDVSQLAVGGTTNSPIALAPDNLSHQLFASGGYNFTPTTRGTFKLSFTSASQDDAFISGQSRLAASAGRTGLDGQVDTTLVNAGLTARPADRLSLLANIRYEDRKDKTPKYQFITANTTTRDGFNVPMSRESLQFKGEAAYRLPSNYKITGGLDYEQVERSYPPLRQASWRNKSDEVTGRIELRKSLSDSLNGAIKYAHSTRDGSNYLPAGSAADADVIAPVHWSDRVRDKVKVSLDWTPAEKLSIQFGAEQSIDDYGKLQDIGPDNGVASLFSFDLIYSLSDDWQITGWFAYDKTETDGSSCYMAATSPAVASCGVAVNNTAWRKWNSSLSLEGNSGGIGIKGKLNPKLTIGADAEVIQTTSGYNLTNGAFFQNGTATLPAGATNLPEHKSRLTGLRIFSSYTYRPDITVQADLRHQRFETNDWQWTNGTGGAFGYTNTSTTAELRGAETVNFVGLSLAYKWW